MKDPGHHMRHVQRKVLKSVRNEATQEEQNNIKNNGNMVNGTPQKLSLKKIK